jgi:asparagine synthase (glutamine-hydrolysing)
MKVEMSFHNRYYPWTEVKADGVTCWLKGTFFYENTLLQGADVVRLFSSAIEDSQIDHESLKALLLALSGNFALALETPRYIFCTVDRVRSIPLFYAVSGDEVIFSDDANHLRDRLNPPFNEENGAEFLVTGYVTGPDTLFDGISQLQVGEYLVYDKRDGTLATHFYHRFWHGNFFSDSGENLLDRLDEIFVRIFQRLIASTKGRQIVVPLSGGLDSRIIVAMLKRLGVEDVICFTYGKKGNREAEISRRVAEALGYQWYFVEYTEEKWYDCYHSDEMQRYMKYSGNLASIPHIQDFLAVKELKEEGMICENAVFVPGHSGDMLAGSWIPKDYNQLQAYTFEKFLGESLKKHYSLWKWDATELGPLFEGRIRKCVGDVSVHDNESCANAVELFNFDERQAKFIVNSVRVYEFSGFQWRIPLWDAELIDFFLRVPLLLRLKQVLYREYAVEKLFVGTFEFLQGLECTTYLKAGSKNAARDEFMSEIKSFLSKFPLLRKLGRSIYTFRRIHTEYDTHPLAWYSIIQKESFSQIYSGTENINSFVGLLYIIRISPASLIGIVKKYFKDAKRVLSAEHIPKVSGDRRSHGLEPPHTS